MIYIVAAIFSEIVFHVDESSWSSIKFTSPLNVIVTPHVPGASSDFFNFWFALQYGKYFLPFYHSKQLNFIIRNGRDQKQWKEFAMSCFSSRKIDTYSWVLKLVVSTIRRKKIDHGIFLCVQGGVECDSVEKPFFLLILHRSVLIFKKHEFF